MQEFLTSYLNAFDAMDAQAIANHYTLPCAVDDVDGAQVFSCFDVLLAKLKVNCDAMKNMGYQHSEFNIIEKTCMGDASIALNVAWRTHLTNNSLDFRCLYICHLKHGEWKIFNANVYQGNFN